ncbi:uncharacterized protein N0V89_002444 [Didymosphaeria variabile]|uniref:Uncharacterized protein n=1 Tax=Didymosphaeria variabile TaxID=1932322 RepID=A0A9W8XRN0_9PLEO|nr:uncharacterized protein N0V89_002444 [Didymosphaeria variabile]KAJ4357867.1 hypothetical protein N0V89_002444 [Didymosphaeria variabile]
MQPAPGGEKDLDAWYREEHNEQMSKEPGYKRTTRYSPLFQTRNIGKPSGLDFVAFHQFGEGHKIGTEVEPLEPMSNWTKRAMNNCTSIDAAVYRKKPRDGQSNDVDSQPRAYFNAFRAMEKPVEVRFADGRTGTKQRSCARENLDTDDGTEPIPDITNQLAPSKWSDAATYFFFSLGGLFLGGEAGFLSGTASASRTITKDPEAKERIEKAFKNYRIDAMKQEIQQLEGKSKFEQLFSS